ncbi:MAG: GspE/PulE family protein [Planctomycetes bacterium]|nr:GspE/PulE family protein [Planctomycetota bacterium]
MAQFDPTSTARSIARSSGVDAKRILDVLLRTLVQKKTVSPEDLDTILGITIRKVADTVYAQAVSVFMVDKATQRIRFKNVYYSPSLYGLDGAKKKFFDAKAKELENVTLALDQGIVGKVIQTGEPIFLEDVHKDASFSDQIDKSTGFKTVSMIAVPLKVDDQTIGCIQVLNKCPDSKRVVKFTEEDVNLVLEVATYSAKVVQRALDPNPPFSDKEMARYVAKLANCEYMELDPTFEPATVLMDQLGEEVLKRYQILPLAKIAEKTLKVGLSNPLDFQSIQDFEVVTGYKMGERIVLSSGDIKEALLKAYPEASQVSEMADVIKDEFGVGDATSDVAVRDEDDENSAPIVKLANRIIEDAYIQGASDIHVEPFENKVMVRYRIDGICKEKLALPKQAHRALVSRFKIMSELNIAERRLPQDGRIVYKKFNAKFDLDLRVSVAPMNHGEKLCMRILDKTKSTLPLDKLGFSPYNLELYRRVIQAPYGMILHCGPTGSGKSMTLYAALNEINSPEWNISTAEDPIEYTLAGINQMQVKKDIGLTFAAALRCYLRQDPDIILVGEIRDQETAEIATEAALTGHVLLSTLHTNDAPSTITRLVEMGIEPFMLSTSLICVCAQRLMRRLCSCKVAGDPRPDELEYLLRARDEALVTKINRPSGCPKCGKTGYKGRTGIHELMVNTDELREIINKHGNSEQIKEAARRGGMRTLFEDAMEKVKLGITSLPESMGTAKPDDQFVKTTYEAAASEAAWAKQQKGEKRSGGHPAVASKQAAASTAAAPAVEAPTPEKKSTGNTVVGLGWLAEVDEKDKK